MKIKMLESCAGTRFSYTKGTTIEVPDKVGKDLVKAGYAESLEKAKKAKTVEATDAEVKVTAKEEK